jgi:putative ABC transport system substrate-binding protein
VFPIRSCAGRSFSTASSSRASPQDSDHRTGKEARQRFAKEIVALLPDLILAYNTPTTAAVLQQTRTIPIIFLNVSDPIGSGFVASFPRPGGNVTGFTNIEISQAGKWLELLKEIAPPVNRIAFLFNPVTAPYAEHYLDSFKAAAASFAVEAIAGPVRDASELESVVAALARAPNGSLIVMTDSFMTAHRVEITALAARNRLPAVYPYRFFAELGGLVSYGNDLTDNWRRAASYADRILKGEKSHSRASGERLATQSLGAGRGHVRDFLMVRRTDRDFEK